MVHLIDVGARFGNDGRDAGQYAGRVACVDLDARQPPGAHHAALQDGSQQQRVDVAPAQHQPHLLAGKARGVLQQGRQARSAGAFDQGLFDLQQHHDGLLDVAFVDQHQVVHVLADQLAGDAPGLPHGNAFGDGAGTLRVGRAFDGVDHGREAAGLHADDLHAGLERAHRGGDAADQPATAHRDDQGVQRGLGAQHLDAYGALAGNHRFIVEGVDETQALLDRQLHGAVARFVEGFAVQHHLGVEAAGALHLHHGRIHGHHDHGPQAQALCVVGHALGVVAGGRGDHTADRLARLDQRGQLVERAALLERGRELQVFELQEDLRAQDLAQGA